MVVKKTVCDGCKREIEGNLFRVFVYEVDSETGGYKNSLSGSRKDFCKKCSSELQGIIEGYVAEESDVEICEQAAVESGADGVEDEIEDTDSDGPIYAEADSEETGETEQEERGVESVHHTEDAGDGTGSESDKTIKQLILEGKSVDEICEIKNCKRNSVFVLRSKMMKSGEIPKKQDTEDGSPVECTKVIGTCRYKGKIGSDYFCDYLGITGKRRGLQDNRVYKVFKKLDGGKNYGYKIYRD